MVPVQPSVPAALAEAARAEGELDVLLLFGSRSRGDAGTHSDWDLGYLATDAFDVARWLGVAVEILGTDRVAK
jgi:predicted nucleotidyltransferase